jgi:hypothetical protein
MNQTSKNFKRIYNILLMLAARKMHILDAIQIHLLITLTYLVSGG